MVPRTEAALPRCKATETCCRMKERDCASLDTALTQLPMSAKKSRTSVILIALPDCNTVAGSMERPRGEIEIGDHSFLWVCT